MSTAAFYNDGSIPYGARLETFSRSGSGIGSYVLENVTIKRKSKLISRYDELGAPDGSVGVFDFDEGSAVAQLATSGSTPLRRGDTFTDTFDAGTGAEKWFVTEVDQPESQNEYKKQSVNFRKAYH